MKRKKLKRLLEAQTAKITLMEKTIRELVFQMRELTDAIDSMEGSAPHPTRLRHNPDQDQP
jgi:hypothetical protein